MPPLLVHYQRKHAQYLSSKPCLGNQVLGAVTQCFEQTNDKNPFLTVRMR
jgi:hypothetical protein